MADDSRNLVFDYRALRLLIGALAFLLPFVVGGLADRPLTSISASYHTGARDTFVGWMFVIGAFLLAYNGHSRPEWRAAKAAALAAVCVALFPTACDTCEVGWVSWVHFIAAATLFSILAYFCLGPFRKDTKGQPGKRGRRARIYFACGWTIIACMAGAALLKLVLPGDVAASLPVLYWAEAIALLAFGVAWVVSGKVIAPLVDRKDALPMTELIGRAPRQAR